MHLELTTIFSNLYCVLFVLRDRVVPLWISYVYVDFELY